MMGKNEYKIDVLFVSGLNFVDCVEQPQLGQLILLDILKKKGYTGELINFDFLNTNGILPYKKSFDDIIQNCVTYIVAMKPRIVSFYCMCDSFSITVQIAELLKKKLNKTKIIFGGPHATLLAKECLEAFDFLDLIAIGEGEKTIVPIINSLISNSNFESLQGVVFKNNDNKIIKNICPKFLNSIELGEHVIYDYSPIEINEQSIIALEGGRGCPYECSFCSTSIFWGRNFRIKSVEDIISEMNEFNRLYGVNTFNIVHDMFTAKYNYIMKFCSTLSKNKRKYKWLCSTRIDHIDNELLKNMVQAGCYNIYLGIETGSQRLQKEIKKNLNLKDVYKKIKIGGKYNIVFEASFIYGMPDEDIKDFQDTIKMIEELLTYDNCELQLHRFIPLPTTEATNKIYDKIVLNKKNLGLSIYDVCPDNERGIYLSSRFPKLFTQHYKYVSEVTIKYLYFETLVYSLNFASKAYKATITHIMRIYGLEKLYFMFKSDIVVYSNIVSNLNVQKKIYKKNINMLLLELATHILSCIMESESQNDFKDIYRFESYIKELQFAKNYDEKIFESDIDVLKARESERIESCKTYIHMYVENKKIIIKRVNKLFATLKKIEISNKNDIL